MSNFEKIDFSTIEGQKQFDELDQKKKEKMVEKSYTEAHAIDDAAEKNHEYSKKLIEAKTKRATNEAYGFGNNKKIDDDLKKIIENAEYDVNEKMDYIGKQIREFAGGEPLVEITAEEFEYYASLYKKDIIDWTDKKFGDDYRLLDLGNHSKGYKLILKQEPDKKFRLCLFPKAKWEQDVLNNKDEDKERFEQALEEAEIPKNLRKK